MMWRDAYESRRGGGGEPRGVARLVGDSPPMRDLKEKIPWVAGAPFPVVIEGESGTGKELIARAIHEEGPRRAAAFVPVNCAVLGDELFESELFGHASLHRRRAGPQGPAGAVLRWHRLSRRGGRADAARPRRSCCACSRTARAGGWARTARRGSTCGSWRPRTGRSPPRRPTAASAATCSTASTSSGSSPRRSGSADRTSPGSPSTAGRGVAAAAGSRATLARETVAALAAHPWLRNVRELQNVLASLTVTGPRYGPVGPGALPAAFRTVAPAERQPTLAAAREDLEREMVRDALGRRRSVARGAGELGVTRQGLSKLMARLQIDLFNPGRDRLAQMPSR